ncbi:unnamed protein product [Nippostrongylus brasiliensis]|uniref:Carbohydrate sulfotransferase n=1 Tax=Nippostrongylus brasiliensis TaxID=27835 RepID=A0A158QY16_NIPBR|nr:unnamed protein product [Nippostrongylus brasiliensis]
MPVGDIHGIVVMKIVVFVCLYLSAVSHRTMWELQKPLATNQNFGIELDSIKFASAGGSVANVIRKNMPLPPFVRFCEKQQKLTIRSNETELEGTTRFAFIRHPIDRFLSGYVNKCLLPSSNEIKYGVFDCYGCKQSLSCFIERFHDQIWDVYKKNNSELKYFIINHLAPQTWYCNFKNRLRDFVLIKYSRESRGISAMANQLDVVLRHAEIPLYLRKQIAEAIIVLAVPLCESPLCPFSLGVFGQLKLIDLRFKYLSLVSGTFDTAPFEKTKLVPPFYSLCRRRILHDNYTKVEKMLGSTRIVFVRHPIDRFLSGFVNKCVRKKENGENCFGCGADLSCFLPRFYDHLMMKYSVHDARNRSFISVHLSPQSWYCDFKEHLRDYTVIRYVNSASDSISNAVELFNLENRTTQRNGLMREKKLNNNYTLTALYYPY